jgi:hypothetical protein
MALKISEGGFAMSTSSRYWKSFRFARILIIAVPTKQVKLAAAVATLALSACVSTQDVSKSLTTRYIGQPSDAFFAQYGAPVNSTHLNDGDTVYNWHGGDSVIVIPPEYKSFETPGSSPMAGSSNQMLVHPAKQKRIYCEARITTDAQGRIVSVEATHDTEGETFSMSRCAEVFNVK